MRQGTVQMQPPRGPSIPVPEPVYPRSLLLEAAQHLLKRSSLPSYACCACPSAGCARKPLRLQWDPSPPSQPCRRCGGSGAASCLLRLCVSACCARQAAPLRACRGAPRLRVYCLRLLRINCHCHFGSIQFNCKCHFSAPQLAGSLRPPVSNQYFLEHGISRSCCINIYATARPARRPANQEAGKAANQQAGTHCSQQTLNNMTGSLHDGVAL